MSNATAGLSFTVTREQLRTGLAAVTPALSSAKATLPVLEQVLVEASEGAIHLAATDLNIAIRMRLAASVGRTGRCTLPAKRLAAIVRELEPLAAELLNRADPRQVLRGKGSQEIRAALDEYAELIMKELTDAR